MSSPRLSDRALLAWVAATVVAVVTVGATVAAAVLTAPILPATEPYTTGTAAPIPPCGPVELTAVPLHGWGPR